MGFQVWSQQMWKKRNKLCFKTENGALCHGREPSYQNSQSNKWGSRGVEKSRSSSGDYLGTPFTIDWNLLVSDTKTECASTSSKLAYLTFACFNQIGLFFGKAQIWNLNKVLSGKKSMWEKHQLNRATLNSDQSTVVVDKCRVHHNVSISKPASHCSALHYN